MDTKPASEKNGINEAAEHVPSSTVTMDDLLMKSGNFSYYQCKLLAITCLLSFIPASMVVTNVFTIAAPAHRCRIPLYDANSTNPSYNITIAQLDAAIPYQYAENNESVHASCYMYMDIPRTAGEPPEWLSSTSPSSSELASKRIRTCNEDEGNDPYVFDVGEYGHTFTLDEQLVCTHAYMAQIPQTLYVLGILIGSFVAGWTADKFGRRPTMLVSCALFTLFSLLSCVAPEYYTFCICRTITGACDHAVYQTAFVILVEFVSNNKRVLASSIWQLSFPFGEATAAAIGMAKLPWRWYIAVLSAPNILALILVVLFLDETPRYLTTTEQFGRLEKLMQKISRANKAPAATTALTAQDVQNFEAAQKSAHRHTEGGRLRGGDGEHAAQFVVVSKLDLFRYPKLRLNFLTQAFCWLVVSLVFYGLSMNVTSLGGNAYVDSILISLVEIPSYFLAWFTLDYLGRRFVSFSTFFLSGVATMLIAFVPAEQSVQWVVVVLAMVGKLAITTTFATVYVYASELFPTPVRTFAVGCASVTARVGGMVASEVALLTQIWRPAPFLLFGFGGLVAAALCLLLPETAGRTLPETIEDTERLPRGDFMFPFRNCLGSTTRRRQTVRPASE